MASLTIGNKKKNYRSQKARENTIILFLIAYC